MQQRCAVMCVFVLLCGAFAAFGCSGSGDNGGDSLKSPDMVLIPSGTFTMGSPAGESGRSSNETPHQVTITKSFYMSKYPVTQGLYQAVLDYNHSYFTHAKGRAAGQDDTKLPVENVCWYEAIVFCNVLSMMEGLAPVYSINGSTNPTNWSELLGVSSIQELFTWEEEEKWATPAVLSAAAKADAALMVEGANGYRLPTEAEWEYACRAGTATAFNWGTDTAGADKANYDASNLEKTTEAGKYAPNAWGLYDMHGNVAELCWDWYGSLTDTAATDPAGPASGTRRVYRGGSYSFDSSGIRSGWRSSIEPGNRYINLGFRVVRIP
jgi:formylglycine-generating enzyme required for sulfatase activity